MTNGLQNWRLADTRRMLSDKRGESVAGPYLDKTVIPFPQQELDTGGKLHRLAEMFRIVGWVGRLISGDPFPGHIADVRNLRRLQRDFAYPLGEGREHRLHHC